MKPVFLLWKNTNYLGRILIEVFDSKESAEAYLEEHPDRLTPNERKRFQIEERIPKKYV